MKAPKNFYNTVDQSKLGIDDLFTRTAENEADITALETVVGDLDGGLVKDVHDLQDDSEQYHDDIADLKNADIAIGLRIDDLEDEMPEILTGTLTAGQTSLTIASAYITTNSIIDIYVDVFGVDPTNVVVTTGSITITFDVQTTDLSVKVVII